MLTTLMLAAGLLTAPEPQGPPQGQGWVVEIRDQHFYQREKPQEWIIELNGFTRHRNVIELQIEPVEVHYYDDLSEFFKQFSHSR